LLIIIWGLLQTEWGQNWLARQITRKLSRDLQSRISIDRVNIGFFNKMDLEGVLVEDQKQDTLFYAGKVQVRITDWFFFKDKADLKYVGLNDATIYFNRTDSVWNYKYLEDYFAPPGSSEKKKSGIEFNLQKVVMNNVTFIKRDAWLGNDLTARVKHLDLDADEITLTGKKVDVNNLTLSEPYFASRNYTGNRRDSILAAVTPKSSASEPGWTVTIRNISINNGRYRSDNGTGAAIANAFDGKHMDFSSITGSIKDMRWISDTLRASINLTTRERSGLEVKSLKAEATVHPEAMIFDKLYLQTNRSVLGNYFAMRYDSIGAMSDFIHAVTMEANFSKSSISSDDIAFFAPAIRDWNRNIRIDGRLKGTVDALSGEDLEVWAGNNTYINGNLSLVGLPNIKETFISIEARDLRTTYADAVSFIPGIRKITTPNLSRLSYLRFKGNYTGFVNDFVTYGTLQTNLGTLVTDLNMKFPKGGDPVYSGKLSTTGFELGSFINSPSLGAVAFNGSVKGKSFQWQSLDMEIDGTVQRIEYGNYTYQNITAKGRLNNRMFNGDFVIKDPNADLTLSGLIDLSGKQPLFNVKADIARADLKALQLTREELELSGAFDLNIQGSSLSDLLGDARISNATLLHKGRRLSFDSLNVSSHYVNGLKVLKASSNEFDATVTGNFDLETLPNAFTLFLSRYYPSYIRPPRNVRPQTFTFDITTGIIEDYVKLIDPRLSGFNNSRIKGSLDINTNNMTIDADVPQFGFEQYQFSDIQLKGSGDLEKLTMTGQVNNAVISDSLTFPQTTFSISAANDVSDININTTANQTINQANLSAQIKTFSDGATVLFNPSSFILNGKTWSIEQGGELNFRRNTVVQGALVLRESNQEIRVETRPSDIGNWNDLHIALQNIKLGDFSPFFLKKNRLEGDLSGEVVIEDPQSRFNISTNNLKVEELRVDNDSIGLVTLAANYEKSTGMLTARGSNADPEHRLNFDAAIDLNDPDNLFLDRITINPDNFQVTILERFVGTLFSNLQGYVTGQVNILGEGASRDYVGKVRLRDAGMKVNFSQVFYRVEDTDIELKEDMIDFGTIRLRDTLGNLATATGYIRHKGFANMYYDIVVQTATRPMLLLNTNFTHNQQFYGRAMGTGSLVLLGPQHDMYMHIDAQASNVDSSYIVLPLSETRESGQASFMVERKYGREMNENTYSGAATNMTFEVNLTATPLVNVEVILDETTGDVIRGKGSGNLRIASGTSSPLTIRGRYDIEEGNYDYTFQTFLKKPFVLRKGANNYIEWTGDPFDARINFDAVYTADNVSMAPLVTGLALNQNLSTIREDVNVIVSLTDKLFSPTLSFDIELPPNSTLARDPSVAFGLQQIERNNNELTKQVAYLIAFNSFAPYENYATDNFRPIQEFTYNTISGLLFNEINKRLNQLLSSILRNNELTLNLSGSLYNRGLTGVTGNTQSNFNLTLGRSFFEGRLSFTVGGTFDVPLQQSSINEKVNLLPDVTVELLLNKSGSMRATFFYRENMDFLTGNSPGLRARRYGSSISYNKEFQSFFAALFGNGNRRGGIRKDSTSQKPRTDSVKKAASDTTVVTKGGE
jgi:hypothetical protein